MKEYILMQKFGSQLEEEYNSRRNCEKSLIIFKVIVPAHLLLNFLVR
jgi:hypothetical protein